MNETAGDLILRFPGGRYRLTASENERLCRAVGVEPDSDGRAHPIFFYIAAQCGMGISVADLCTAFDFDVNDGPMMLRSGVEFACDLLVDQDYLVEGGVTSIVSKPSRTFGTLDQLTFELLLSDESGQRVLKSVNVWALPRPNRAHYRSRPRAARFTRKMRQSPRRPKSPDR